MTRLPIRKNIIWKVEYNIKVEAIDKEHKELFEIAQKALMINNIKDNKVRGEELKKVISKLLMYTKIHFAHEQNYMKSINYPDLARHILLHKHMVEGLTLLIKNINELSIIEIEDKIYIFIEEYFLHHIITEDKKIHLWNTPLENLKNEFGWKDVYSVDNRFIDNEHKMLFDIAEEAFQTVDSPNRITKIRTVVKKLYDYMQKHFENEEQYMDEIEYPHFEEHKRLHENIIRQLNEFIKSIPHMQLSIFEKELARIIDISLLQHIIQEDRKITKWVNNR